MMAADDLPLAVGIVTDILNPLPQPWGQFHMHLALTAPQLPQMLSALVTLSGLGK